MNQGAATSHQPEILQTFIKKILLHLDDNETKNLQQFLSYFNNTNCKIIFNGAPFAQPMIFLQMWQEQFVQTQHALTSLDYQIIPGSGTMILNINSKVRFDESGRDRLGQDALIKDGSNRGGLNNNTRPIFGSYFGVSLQLVIDDRIFRNDFNGVISCFNYNMLYKPEDSLIKIH
ncbi:Mtr2p NDAI_0D04590 [Naumovozyma dairenensis CBS 421]|uniref:NTF2 domain-containing protein n=1 Tax=Naumovozyma dairenensis (strain ATCC 10597 / BCRC 20456 / CBS 421 / NBRC 0211 / NRRL Y-12639) TaxID=1071378 RepID=G0WAG1_NAUDC|nr:hypothetical protein NDAI_0D04590 [Naumovozyma dairenensis CBS 421]CCD24772.1 hypothetical protein NDAI_0D04590 [Naumovozyma dairenensis CBS 421]